MPVVKEKAIVTSKDFTPRSPAQHLFFQRDLDETYDICMGGSAYGGKTACMLISSLLYADNPHYRAAFFRREQAQLENSGLLDEAVKWYTQIYPKVIYNKVAKTFTFPSGAKIRFFGCEGDNDYLKFKGAEWHAIYFEELTQFTEEQYGFLCSRVRNPKGKIPLRIRSSTNPGDINENWVMQRYMPWIYPYCFEKVDPEIKARMGDILYYYADQEKDYEIVVTDKKPTGKHKEDYFTFSFIRTHASDLGDGQEQRLAVNVKDPVLRMQQLDGIWGLRAGAGMYFAEEDFRESPEKGKQATRVRYWDKACSGKKGDYLVGLLMCRTFDDKFIVEDVVIAKPEVHEVEKLMMRTAMNDGKAVHIAIEQEGGSAGKEISYKYEKEFRKEGFVVHIDVKTANKTTQSKLARAQLLSPKVKEGSVGLLAGGAAWKMEFLKQVVNFPAKGVHDDCVDAFTGAYLMLTTKIPAPLAHSQHLDFVRKVNQALPTNLYAGRSMY